MAEEVKSAEQAQADEDFANSEARHPVIRAAEEKLAAVEAGERVDVARHNEIRAKHLGLESLTPEQRLDMLENAEG
jgi:hypothetical protein